MASGAGIVWMIVVHSGREAARSWPGWEALLPSSNWVIWFQHPTWMDGDTICEAKPMWLQVGLRSQDFYRGTLLFNKSCCDMGSFENMETSFSRLHNKVLVTSTCDGGCKDEREWSMDVGLVSPRPAFSPLNPCNISSLHGFTHWPFSSAWKCMFVIFKACDAWRLKVTAGSVNFFQASKVPRKLVKGTKAQELDILKTGWVLVG